MLTRRTLLGASLGSFCRAAEKPKNVLFLMADDLNVSLGCYGHPLVKTPHIDALAARGVRFDRMYCQFPLCGPSRASLLTGLRPDTTKVLGNNVDFRLHRPEAVTLPQLFKNSGYFAGRVGKMFHMNVPNEVGTNRFQDEASWHHSFSPPGLENKSPGRKFEMRMPPIQTADDKGQADTNGADAAIELLEKHRGEPFFLGVGMLRPHLPWVAPSRFFDLYPSSSVTLAENRPNDQDDIPRAHLGVRPHLWRHMQMPEAHQQEARRAYYASTSYMDEQIGRVVGALDRLGLRDNTIIAFMGDHGWSLGEHTHWQKMNLFETNARVPFILSAPGQAGNGRATTALTEFVDVYPTITELTGKTPPGDLEGQSMVRVLRQPNRAFKKAAFTQLQFEDRIVGRSMRTARYRYNVWEGEGGGEEVYDHQVDPGEFTNRIDTPVAAELRAQFARGWRAARA
jgi:iduronate 2-sulfatase